MGIMICAKCDKHIDLDTDGDEWVDECAMCWECFSKFQFDFAESENEMDLF